MASTVQAVTGVEFETLRSRVLTTYDATVAPLAAAAVHVTFIVWEPATDPVTVVITIAPGALKTVTLGYGCADVTDCPDHVAITEIA